MITDRAVILFHSIRQNSSRVPIKVESSTIDGTLSLSLSLPYFFLLPSRFYASAALRSLCPRFVSLFNSSPLFCYAYKKLSPSPQHLATPLLARLTFFSLLFFSFLFFPRNLATRRVNSKVNYLTSAERQTLRNEEYREYFEEGESTRGVSS